MNLQSENSLFWFIRQSLQLDVKFFRVSSWSVWKNFTFFAKKYWLIFKHFVFNCPFELGKSKVGIFGKGIYYDSRFGLAGYQSILTRHQNMVDIAGMKNIETIVDVGAHVGFFSLFMQGRFPEAKIYAIEPLSQIFKALQNNLGKDQSVNLVQTAISNYEGEQEMYFDTVNAAESMLVFDKENIRKSNLETVKVTLLDILVAGWELDDVDVLKIDVESFEKHVLEGSQDTLAKTRYLFMEVTVKDNSNYTFTELMSKLYKKDSYNFQLIAYRNFTNEGEGEMPIADFLFKNIYI